MSSGTKTAAGGSAAAMDIASPTKATAPTTTNARNPDLSEIGHYVVTSHPPGAVFSSFKCSFLSENSSDLVISKANRLEIRRFQLPQSPVAAGEKSASHDAAAVDANADANLLPLALSLPINGRILAIAPIRFPNAKRDCLFFITEKGSYSLISYDETLAKSNNDNGNSSGSGGGSAMASITTASGSGGQSSTPSTPATASSSAGEHYPILTHATGTFKSYNESVLAGGRIAEMGPMLSVDPLMRCICLHAYDGYLTIIPVNRGYELGRCRRVPWRRNNLHAAGGGGGGGANSLAGGSGKPAATKPRGAFASAPFSDAFHLRIEERTLIHMTFLRPQLPSSTSATATQTKSHYMPQLAILHQDSYDKQHVTSHGIDLQKKALVPNGQLTSSNNNPRNKKKPPSAGGTMPPAGEQLKYGRCEGGSSCLIAVPPPPPPMKNKGGADRGMGGDGKLAATGSSSKHLGGILILGQRQITYHCTAEGTTKISPTGGMLFVSHCRVSEPELLVNTANGDAEQVVRWLVGDSVGRLHLLSVLRKNGMVTTLHLDTLGTCSTSSTLSYLGKGLVFVGGQFANSQLIRILDEPVPTGTVCGGFSGDEVTKGSVLEDTTYVKLLEEYTNLGPIVDFDLRACNDDDTSPKVEGGKYRQSLVATCSGVAKDGTIRLVRNGVGMKEHAAVEMEGIKGMWSLRKRFEDEDDTYLVQSFVRETRILGVQSTGDVEMEDGEEGGDEENEEEEGGALAEVTIDGFNSSKPTLFAGNLLVDKFDLLVQVVEDGVRLVDAHTLDSVASWSPFTASDEDSDDDDEPMGFITVASANKSGQIVVALRGGALVYLVAEAGVVGGASPAIRRVKRVTLDRDISCIDLNPFGATTASESNMDAMEGDATGSSSPRKSQLVAVGLWDDFSIRLLNLAGSDPSSVLEQVLHINLGRGSNSEGNLSRASISDADSDEHLGEGGQHMMARSLCLVTMDSQSSSGSSSSIVNNSSSPLTTAVSNVDMLLVGLGDGKLISFVVNQQSPSLNKKWSVHSRKEVSLGTQGIHLIPFQHGSSKSSSGSCVLATGDRPTVVYLTGGAAGSNSNPKLNYSTITLTVEEEDDDEDEAVGEGGGGHASHKSISVNVATPFNSSLLFSSSASPAANSTSLGGNNSVVSSLCIADEATLRLGTISDIQKLHVSSYKIGMTPRRICHHEAGRVYVVGCIGEVELGGEGNANNFVRFFDDSTFEELSRIPLDEFEMILTIESVMLTVNLPPGDEKCSDNTTSPAEYQPFIVLGTAYAYPGEDEPSQGRVIVVECNTGASGNLKSEDEEAHMHNRRVRQVAEMPLMGGVYSIAPFYHGQILVTCGSKTVLCQLCASIAEPGELLMNHIGMGHHGHIISLSVKSLVNSDKSLQKTDPQGNESQLAIVGDLMRSISVVEYYPKHQVIEELARDFNSNYCTEIAMLTNNIYMGCEGFNNLFTLKYNPDAKFEQARCRLDTVGQYHLGEMVNRMIGGSLIMPSNNASTSGGSSGASSNETGKVMDSPDKASSDDRKVDIAIGSQTLYATVDGTIGTVLGLPGKLFAFLICLQRCMDAIVRPVGDLSRQHYRQWEQGAKGHSSCGFIDGDWIETFLDLNRANMERVVKEMNKDGRWRIRDNGVGFDDRNDKGQRPNQLMDTEDVDAAKSSDALCVLTVEDVLAVVEELSMLH